MIFRTILVVFFSLYCSSASAATVLDQYSFRDLIQGTNSTIAVLSNANGNFRRAQTFTVGVDGYIDSIIVELNEGVKDFTPSFYAQEMRILDTSPSGAPTNNIIASVDTYILNNVFGIFDFRSLNIFANAGTVLAFEIVGAGAIQGNNNLYLGGSDFVINKYRNINDWQQDLPTDLAFQTYMSPVPLPTSVILFAPSLAGLLLLKSKRLKNTITIEFL